MVSLSNFCRQLKNNLFPHFIILNFELFQSFFLNLQYGILESGSDLMSDIDLHIHFPAGAVSKEGPSAGITTACAILSLFSGIPLAPRLAMTGEITLQGTVLPVSLCNIVAFTTSRCVLSQVSLGHKINLRTIHI